MAGSTQRYDLIVIGGGINGAGVARDAARRGLRVLLLEARDFGSGTSSWSSRLIHGGLRYLEYGELSLVYESLHERRYLRRIAGHLVQPLRLTIPLYRGGRRPRWMVRLGLLAYDLLSWRKQLPRHRMLDREALLRQTPGLNAAGLKGGAQYFDAQVTYAERLVIENIVDAAASGARVCNYSPVSAIDVGANGVASVQYRCDADGAACRAEAEVVVNASGPWVDRVLANAGTPPGRLMGGTKGSHIVVGRFQDAPRDAYYVEARSDGRPVFILPWNEQYLIGTTDLRFDGDPGDARPSAGEIDYLLQAANAVFPNANLSRGDIHYAYAGVRPLPWHAAGPESAITRRHIIHRHAAPADRLLSVIGGKLTTYRNLAEQVVDQVVALQRATLASCDTARSPLPGAQGLDEAATALAAVPGLSAACRQRLLSIYGGRSLRLVQLIDENPQLAAALDAEARVIGAEVVLAIREEFAQSLTDLLHRRLMVGLGADLGASISDAVLAVAAREFDWSDAAIRRERAALRAYNQRLERVPASDARR